MTITVTTRHISDRKKAEELKAYALKKTKRIERYTKAHRGPSDLKFILTSEKYRYIVEITINSGPLKVTNKVETDDMHTAIDSAVDSVIRQLKKESQKMIKSKRRVGAKSKEESSMTRAMATETPKSAAQKITRRKLPSKPMSTEEATLQLDLSDNGFVTYIDSETGNQNIVFRDKRGKIILIEP